MVGSLLCSAVRIIGHWEFVCQRSENLRKFPAECGTHLDTLRVGIPQAAEPLVHYVETGRLELPCNLFYRLAAPSLRREKAQAIKR